MITIKNKQSIEKMAVAGGLLSNILRDIRPLICAGATTADIDMWIEEQLTKNGLVSQSKGYHGYRFVSCISVNDEVVHGIPHKQTILSDGDLIKVDVCAAWQGYCADMARAFIVGSAVLIDSPVQKFIDVAQKALDKGISKAYAGNRLSDISFAIQHEVESHGYGIVRDFAGHGIGKKMHESPEILNYGEPGKGPLLKPGMAFAIEPMITMGDYSVYVAKDGWTVRTKDKSLAMHVEDTIIITENGPYIITRHDQQNMRAL